MKKATKQIIYLAAGLAAVVLLTSGTSAGSLFAAAENLIISFENYSPSPYWDVSRYSWGYGTPAPGATGTITREKALQELRQYTSADYNYLQPLITRPLNANQWAALLSFSYNVGPYAADNLVPNINSGNDTALHNQWLLYMKADGVHNAALARRRAAEWLQWIS